jgi:predicted DNA-binding transcriptional regulator AlpA
MTGLTVGQLDHAVHARTFPAPSGHSHHRGARIWDPAEVAAWMSKPDPALSKPRALPKPRVLPDGRTSAEVASMLGVTTRTLHNWIADGCFPLPIDRASHHWRWDPEVVAAWIVARDAANAHTAAEEASPGTSSPATAKAAPRPPYAPALAHSLLGGSSLLALLVAV